MSLDFNYEISRLVLVDSAGFAYNEMQINRHSILLGDGNLGKSSALNALRLFLMPEVNFHKSRIKFAYRVPKEKNKFYSNDECYNHYLPSTRSHLVLEVENTEGVHCQILHRSGSHLGYGRIFAACPYDRIRHLFWNGEGDEYGIGQAVPDLSHRHITTQLKKLGVQFETANTREQLVTKLYTCDLTHPERSRYCLFPLMNNDPAQADSLRTLLLLLFETGADSETVAKALASIIDSDNRHQDDALNWDIDAFFARHEELEANGIRLNRIEKGRGRFNQLLKQHQRYCQLDQTEQDFVDYASWLEDCYNDVAAKRDALLPQISDAKSAVTVTEEILRKHTNQKKELDSTIRLRTKDLKRCSDIYNRAETLINSYPEGFSRDEMLSILQEEKESATQTLEALNDEGLAAERRARLDEMIRQTNHEIDDLVAQDQQKLNRLSRQLPDYVMQRLLAINPAFSRMHSDVGLTDQQKSTLTGFAELLEEQETGKDFFLFHQVFRRPDLAALEADYTRQIEDKRAIVVKYEQEKKTLRSTDDPTQRQKKITHEQEKLAAARQAIEDLEEYASVSRQMPRLEAEISEAREQTAIEKGSIEREGVVLDEKRSALAALENQRNDSNRILGELKSREELCSNIALNWPRLQRARNQLKPDHERFAKTTPEEDFLRSIQAEMREYDQLRQDIVQAVQAFVRDDRIVDDEDRVLTEAPDGRAINQTLKRIRQAYENLPQNLEQHRNDVEQHNQGVAGYIHFIQRHSDHISRFQSQVNDAFKTARINDLSTIELQIHLHPTFKNLLRDLEKQDVYGGELLTRQFYDRLKAFVTEFFKDGVPRLTMAQIIRDMSYRYKKGDSQQWETKAQSNSTTALITLELVQSLLGRLQKAGTSLKLPMILDEVSTVNVSQFDWLLPHLEQRGYSLMAAGTYSTSADLIYKIGNRYELGRMKTDHPYHPERRWVFWGGPESFVQDGAEAEALQLTDDDQLGLLEHEAEAVV